MVVQWVPGDMPSLLAEDHLSSCLSDRTKSWKWMREPPTPPDLQLFVQVQPHSERPVAKAHALTPPWPRRHPAPAVPVSCHMPAWPLARPVCEILERTLFLWPLWPLGVFVGSMSVPCFAVSRSFPAQWIGDIPCWQVSGWLQGGILGAEGCPRTRLCWTFGCMSIGSTPGSAGAGSWGCGASVSETLWLPQQVEVRQVSQAERIKPSGNMGLIGLTWLQVRI